MGFLEPRCLRSSDNVKSFSCGNESLDKWLREDAYDNQEKDCIRVFVSLYQDRPQIAGYCALTCAHISSSDNKTGRFFDPIFVIPCVYLARLAVDKEAQNQGLGRTLLRFAINRALQAAENIGLSLFITEPVDEVAKGFYKHHEFNPMEDRHSGRIIYNLPLKDIREDR